MTVHVRGYSCSLFFPHGMAAIKQTTKQEEYAFWNKQPSVGEATIYSST